MNGFGIAHNHHRLIYLRDLLYELVVRDLKLRYERSMLGIIWSLFYSLAQMRVFTFLFRSVLDINTANYPAFVFSGVLIWNWFQSSLILGSEAITGNRDLVKRPGFPTVVLPIVTVATSLIDFLIALPILLIFVVVGGNQLAPVLLLLPMVILLQFLFILGLAYLFATFNVTFRDTRHILNVVLRLAFFLTPVFYDTSLVPAQYQWFYQLNPMTHLLNAYRALLLQGELPNPLSILLIAGLVIILLPLGYKIFTRASYRFVEEL